MLDSSGVLDDLKAYFLEEIVIFAEYQNKGYGAAFLEYLEKVVRQKGVQHIELISVNDEHHMHFYKKQGFYAASNLAMMGKHLKIS
jgi:N-acetylglutamate synthase-like GNAT family acetyltransferase